MNLTLIYLVSAYIQNFYLTEFKLLFIYGKLVSYTREAVTYQALGDTCIYVCLYNICLKSVGITLADVF